MNNSGKPNQNLEIHPDDMLYLLLGKHLCLPMQTKKWNLNHSSDDLSKGDTQFYKIVNALGFVQ